MKRSRLDVRDWEAFATLVRLRHFGHAAEELGITQSAMSQRLAKLEADLQLKLLTRSSRGVVPTDEGLALLPEARALIAAKRMALEAAAAIRQQGARPARLFLSNAIVHTALLPRLRKAMEQALDRRFHVDVGAADEIEARLLSAECDLAVTTLPIGKAEFEEALLTRLPMAVAVPADVRLARVTIEELCRHPLLLVPREVEPDLFDALIVAAREKKQRLQVGQTIVAFPSILAMVAMGKGWGIVPSVMKDAAIKGVKVLPLDFLDPPSIRVLVAWRSGNDRAGQYAAILSGIGWAED